MYTVSGMKQMILIWWWEVFDTREEYLDFLKSCDWDLKNPPKTRKNWLCNSISHEYECIVPHMPNGMNADYDSWKIRLEKYLKFLNWEDLIVIWWSLWAMFLLRYLSQNKLWHGVDQLHLIAWERQEQWLSWFSVVSDELTSLVDQCDAIYLYHSKDDDLVSFESSERLMKCLPWAKFEIFKTRWHFLQPAFPELLDNIWIYTR